MTVDEVIAKAFLHARRKSIAPVSGTNKYNELLQLADSMQKLWFEEPDTDWNSRYQRINLTATVTATDTFSLAAASEISYVSRSPQDYVLLTDGTNEQRFTLVKPTQLHKYEDDYVCAQVGNNLVFPKAFTADSTLFGYNIEVPGYIEVPDITAGTETVVVDRPMWLAYMVAAEFVRNDFTRQNQYENLLALADQVMEKMKADNMGAVDEISRDFYVTGETWN